MHQKLAAKLAQQYSPQPKTSPGHQIIFFIVSSLEGLDHLLVPACSTSTLRELKGDIYAKRVSTRNKCRSMNEERVCQGSALSTTVVVRSRFLSLSHASVAPPTIQIVCLPVRPATDFTLAFRSQVPFSRARKTCNMLITVGPPRLSFRVASDGILSA